MAQRHAVIESSGDSIFLRDLDSKSGTAVNGVQVHNAILHPGDQIAFERNRFVLEAPGLPMRNELSVPATANAPSPNITQTMKAIRLPDASTSTPSDAKNERSNKNDIWWLIIAAALIALGLALLFLVKI